MQKDPLLGHHPDLDPPAGQQVMQVAVAIRVQQRLHLGGRLVPALLQRRLAHLPGDRHIRGIEFAVADDLDPGDPRNLLADQLEDGTAEIAGDAFI